MKLFQLYWENELADFCKKNGIKCTSKNQNVPRILKFLKGDTKGILASPKPKGTPKRKTTPKSSKSTKKTKVST